MDNLGFALLHYRIRLSHSRVFLLVCSPLLLLLLAVIPHWGALMPTVRHSLSRLLDQGPSTSAFFLLNALILTIIGSSKLEAARGKLGAQEVEESNIDLVKELAAGQLHAVHAENATRTVQAVGHSYENCPSMLTNGHGNHQNVRDKRRDFLVRSRSLGASNDRLSEKTCRKGEVTMAVVDGDQHKPFNSTSLRLARKYTSGREKARPPIPLISPQRHYLQQSKLMRGSLSHVHAVEESSHAAEPASKKSPVMPAKKTRRAGRATNRMHLPAPGEGSHATEPASKRAPMMPANKAGRAGRNTYNSMDHPALPTQLAPAAAAHHPSFEDVWAGIVAANAANSQHMRAASACDDGSSPVDITQPAPAAAAVPSIRPAVASEPWPVPPSLRAAAANAPKEAARSAVAAAAGAAPATEAAAGVAGKKSNANDDEHDSELEELNRRAEKFIARFNHQMRVQRQESLQRRRRSRPCNHYVQHVSSYQYHVQHPYPGLLVG